MPKKVYLQGILLHNFIQKTDAAGAQRILVETYSDRALSETICKHWFRRFKSNDFDGEDKERSGAPKKLMTKNWKRCFMKTHVWLKLNWQNH